MSREQTCLQGFASDDIHKTMSVFIKNAKNRQVFVRRQPLSLNRVKATAAIRFLVVIARERSDRGNLPGGWLSVKYSTHAFSAEYFADLPE